MQNSDSVFSYGILGVFIAQTPNVNVLVMDVCSI